jgi:hypothetical protein
MHLQDKPTMPKILRDNTAIVLYKVGGEIYCSDANSTAFKFPLIDANVLEGEHALWQAGSIPHEAHTFAPSLPCGLCRRGWPICAGAP